VLFYCKIGGFGGGGYDKGYGGKFDSDNLIHQFNFKTREKAAGTFTNNFGAHY
jgi:hypothetical protein